MSSIKLTKTVVAAVASALCSLGTAGSLLAIYFEMQGFGRPRDTEPRFIYLIVLALVFFACIGVTAFLWRRFFSTTGTAWLIAIVVGMVALLGISLM